MVYEWCTIGDLDMFTEARLNNLKAGEVLKDGTEGLSAKRLSRNGKVAFRWHKRIRGTKDYPTYTIGYYSGGSLNDIRLIALSYNSKADEGINPRDYFENVERQKQLSSKTLREVLEEYEKARWDKNTEITRKERRNQINNMWGDYLDRPLGDLDIVAIDGRFSEFKSQRGAHSSARNGSRHLNALLSRATKFGYIPKNPFDELPDLDIFAHEKFREIYLLPEENVELINGLMDLAGEIGKLKESPKYKKRWHSKYNLVGYRVIELLLYSGMRLNEIKNLKWNQVKMEGNTDWAKDIPYFELNLSKQKQRFAIPITKSMMNLFTFLKKKNYDSTYVFSLGGGKPIGSLRRVCQAIEDYIFPNGFKGGETYKFMPQLLRHNFATHASNCSMTPEQVSAITGHATQSLSSNLGATPVYIHNLIATNLHLYERVEKSLLGEVYGEWFGQPSPEEEEKFQQENPLDDFDIVEDGHKSPRES